MRLNKKVNFFVIKNDYSVIAPFSKMKLKRAFKWANKKICKELSCLLTEYPNNHPDNLSIFLNINKSDISYLGASFLPEDNYIIINKYVSPKSLDEEDDEKEIMNFLKNKKYFRHIMVHELLHYAFTTYLFKNNMPSSWIVGVTSEESKNKFSNRSINKKWLFNDCLDEILTEILALDITKFKNTIYLYENNIRKKDRILFEKLKSKIIEGPLYFEEIVNALYYHDASIFLG